jgi:hypothetical protein
MGAIPDLHGPCLWTLFWLKIIRSGTKSILNESLFPMLYGYRGKISLVAILSPFQPAMLNN